MYYSNLYNVPRLHNYPCNIYYNVSRGLNNCITPTATTVACASTVVHYSTECGQWHARVADNTSYSL
eukprot:702118-Prorocentrum_minimum.AAC.2